MTQAANWAGAAIIILLIAAYALVFAEEKLRLRKSKPVMLAGGIAWILVAIAFQQIGRGDEIATMLREVLLEYAELFLFLLAAISFVNTIADRNVFEALRHKLTKARLSARGIFWITGALTFILSPIVDNMTAALVMGSVAIAALGDNRKLAAAALVNIVVAANAGGAFSPFGDITTLMIWQKGMVQFEEFLVLFLPSLINWLVPAAIMSFLAIGKSPMTAVPNKDVNIRKGGIVVCILFAATITLTVTLERLLHLPPFLGMMTGLACLNVYAYFLGRHKITLNSTSSDPSAHNRRFDIFVILEKIEWDTLLFFYGIMLCIGAVSAIGYLDIASSFLYTDGGATTANVAVGGLSAIFGNIPLTFAVLTMQPEMNTGQWLLLTLTAGTGGSLLAIGSAAGVALMGLGRGKYTFMSHLKWTWAITLGFIASIAMHLVLNREWFIAVTP